MGTTYSIGYWDTAGPEDYDRLRPLSYPGTTIFLLCFSLVNPVSYDNVRKRWINELKHHCPSACILLVGTKYDLRSDEEMVKILAERNMKPISSEEGLNLAKEIGAIGYLETSALTQYGLSVIHDLSIKAPILHHCFNTMTFSTNKKCIIS